MEKLIQLSLSVWLVFIVCSVRTSAAPTPCYQMTNEELQERLKKFNNTIFPPELLQEHRTEDSASFNLKVESRNSGMNCPTDVSELPNSDNAKTYERSVCPWYYDTDHDVRRFPASLPIAVSRCQHPVGMDSSKFICELIYREITVLVKEECDDKKYIFKEETVRIPVGVVAARDRNKVSSQPGSASGPAPIA